MSAQTVIPVATCTDKKDTAAWQSREVITMAARVIRRPQLSEGLSHTDDADKELFLGFCGALDTVGG